jgi:hypothetical protein
MVDAPRLTTWNRRSDALALADPPNRTEFTDGTPRQLTYAQADHVVSAIAGRPPKPAHIAYREYVYRRLQRDLEMILVGDPPAHDQCPGAPPLTKRDCLISFA